MFKSIIKFFFVCIIFIGLLLFYEDIVPSHKSEIDAHSNFDLEKHSLKLQQWLQEEGDVLYSTNSTHIQDLPPNNQTPVLP